MCARNNRGLAPTQGDQARRGNGSDGLIGKGGRGAELARALMIMRQREDSAWPPAYGRATVCAHLAAIKALIGSFAGRISKALV